VMLTQKVESVAHSFFDASLEPYRPFV
jgi:hypothetical protein